MIGVVDYEKQSEARSSFSSGNAMCYYGFKGCKWPEKAYEGDGFRQGDVVEVNVDRRFLTIKYLVNGFLKATQSNQKLADVTRIFVPYAELFCANDAVEWCF